jgi:inorganic pyrophosphatase
MNSSNIYFLPSGEVESFNVVVEIPYGSQNKYEIDAETGALFLDRVIYGAAFYPINYGFIPSTKAADDDAVDVAIFMTNPVPPMTVVKCRAIGLLKKTDAGDQDNVVFAVPIGDPRFDEIKDIADLPSHKIKDVVDFWKNMQKFKKGEWKQLTEIEGIFGAEEAKNEVAAYLNNYKGE